MPDPTRPSLSPSLLDDLKNAIRQVHDPDRLQALARVRGPGWDEGYKTAAIVHGWDDAAQAAHEMLFRAGLPVEEIMKNPLDHPARQILEFAVMAEALWDVWHHQPSRFKGDKFTGYRWLQPIVEARAQEIMNLELIS